MNNASVASLPFNASGGWTAYISTSAVTVYLNAGNNLLRLQATNSAGLANIDSLRITGISPSGGNCNGSAGGDTGGGNGNGNSGGVCNWYGTEYPLCQQTQSGWGWENNQSCISVSTCNSQ